MHQKISVFLFLIVLLGTQLFAQQVEPKTFPDLQYHPNPTEDSLQRLNLVMPQGGKTPPLLVWIGGGAWSYVNRHMEMDLAGRFAAEGIAVASVGHRLSEALWTDPPKVGGIQHPEHIKDIAHAFKWLHDHATEYGYDRNNIFVGGFSSGAHLTALLAMDARYLKAQGLSQEHIRGIIPVGGTYDIENYHSVFVGNPRDLDKLHVESVFGETAEGWRDASPTNYVEQLRVPMLLMSENNTFNYCRIFEDALRETEYREFETIHVHSLGHGPLWQNLSRSDDSPWRDAMVQFIHDKTIKEIAQNDKN